MFKIKPIFKDYIWGGNKLKTVYDKQSDLSIVAESWELSTHPAGVCSIATGEHAGMLLNNYLKLKGKKVIGTKAKSEGDIPILIKLIDAKDNLSVQVHPDDAYAKEHENDLGKTEMWYVLEADEGAQLVYGFKENLTKEAFREAIESNTLSEKLNYVDVHKGDVFFITPGTMHAIGKGIVIAEIQQSSNVTYRVYDYGRVGADGKPRPLHIEKAIEVANLTKAPQLIKVGASIQDSSTYNECSNYNNEALQVKEADETDSIYKVDNKKAEIKTLASCQYFDVKHIALHNELELEASEASFHHLLVTEGTVEITSENEKLAGKKGESFFIPAGSGKYTVCGEGEIVLSAL